MDVFDDSVQAITILQNLSPNTSHDQRIKMNTISGRISSNYFVESYWKVDTTYQ